jgi:hypothetical protein
MVDRYCLYCLFDLQLYWFCPPVLLVVSTAALKVPVAVMTERVFCSRTTNDDTTRPERNLAALLCRCIGHWSHIRFVIDFHVEVSVPVGHCHRSTKFIH